MARPIGSKSKGIILDTVEHLIAEKGPKDISIHDIAEASGLSQGTIYYHYATKDEILFDAIARHIDGMRTEFREWFTRHPEGISPERFLKIILSKGVLLNDRVNMHLFLITECLTGNEILREKFVAKWSEWRDTLASGVREVFPNDPDAEATAYILMLLIDGLVVQEGVRGPTFSAERLVTKMKKVG